MSGMRTTGLGSLAAAWYVKTGDLPQDPSLAPGARSLRRVRER
jgi:hypothetical protein